VNELVCRDVEVPVYGRSSGASTADVLTGAIIGGAIGNQFGSGNGKDAMTVLGAIVGANSADRKNVIVGYRIESQCEKVATRVNQPVITHYRVQYTYNGIEYVQDTTQVYTLGQRVKIQASLR
jgi:uncharacterized protein YcfJ